MSHAFRVSEQDFSGLEYELDGRILKVNVGLLDPNEREELTRQMQRNSGQTVQIMRMGPYLICKFNDRIARLEMATDATLRKIKQLLADILMTSQQHVQTAV